MTALCGGGTSSAQPQFGEVVYVAPAALGAFLNNIPTPWAVALAGYIGRVTFSLATFCTNDPPALPTFTAQDVIDLINPYNPFAYNAAQSKFQDLVGAFMWHDLCRCDSGAIPTVPTPPAAPTGMPNINPPGVGPTYPTGQPCNTFDFGDITFTATGEHTYAGIPAANFTSATVDLLERSRDHDSIGQISFVGIWQDASHNFISSFGVGTNSSGVVASHVSSNKPSNAVYLAPDWSVNTGLSAPITMHAVINMYCGSAPGDQTGVVPSPCPTDPFVQATLDQILALVTLIQRQAAPFAYVTGAAHTGLSGAGSFTVQGLLGARVEITDFGFNTSVESGNPDELWHAGWVNWGNADGVSSRQFLTNEQTLTLPSLAGQYTEFHYSLAPGVVATVTELEREP